MAVISIGTLRYDIISDTTRFVRGIKATVRQKREADRVFREGLTPMQRHNFALMRMFNLYKKGMITKEQTLQQQKKIKQKLREEQRQLRLNGMDLKKYGGSYSTASKKVIAHAAALNRNSKAALRNAAANRAAAKSAAGNTYTNFAGSMGSALGMGGPGAGAFRAATYGPGFLVAGAGMLAFKKMIDETRELETALVDMQVIMGDDAAGEKLVNNLREIARTTPLTSKALIKGTQTMLGYGLAAEGLEDTMYRIGEVAGGDAERMDRLTRAYAQIQTAGKLMGQELLQLVNAGFPVKEIAKAAGVEMDDFRAAMERGEIKAVHMTEALVNLTKEGGMMEGRLERQANTINGKWITAMGKIDQQFAETGESRSGWLKRTIDFFGDIGVASVQSMDTIGQWGGYFTGILGNLGHELGLFGSKLKDTLDINGEQLSNHGKTVRAWGDFIATTFLGVDQAELDAQRKRDRRFQMASNQRKKEQEEQQKILDGRKKIVEAQKKEVDNFVEENTKKVDSIYAEMKAEEDLNGMLSRHKQERKDAMREMTKIRAKSDNATANRYFDAIVERQVAEEKRMRRDMYIESANEAEDKRFEKEKENIKKSSELRKKQIQSEYEWGQAIAKNIANRGVAASNSDSYAAVTQIQAEYDQNSIVNKANEKREKQLEQLKQLEILAQQKAERRHQQRMQMIEQNAQQIGSKP